MDELIGNGRNTNHVIKTLCTAKALLRSQTYAEMMLLELVYLAWAMEMVWSVRS